MASSCSLLLLNSIAAAAAVSDSMPPMQCPLPWTAEHHGLVEPPTSDDLVAKIISRQRDETIFMIGDSTMRQQWKNLCSSMALAVGINPKCEALRAFSKPKGVFILVKAHHECFSFFLRESLHAYDVVCMVRTQ